MESTFRDDIKARLRENGAWCYITYNPLQKGIPDLHAVYEGRAIWLELKYTDSPPSLPHELSAQQSKFLRDIADRGGFAGMLVGTPEGCCFIEADELTPGPTRRFEGDPQPREDFVAWMLTSAKDGAT